MSSRMYEQSSPVPAIVTIPHTAEPGLNSGPSSRCWPVTSKSRSYRCGYAVAWRRHLSALMIEANESTICNKVGSIADAPISSPK